MATTNGGPNLQGAFLPAINVLSQYIKDLSFENPNAPDSMRASGPHPTIKVEFNVSAKPVSEGNIEVELKIEARAQQEEKVLFNIDLTYAGVFRVQNIPQEALQPLILIECPRLLFPFARRVVADCTRDGGFPALMLDPIDFVGLFRRRVQQQQQQGETGQA